VKSKASIESAASERTAPSARMNGGSHAGRNLKPPAAAQARQEAPASGAGKAAPSPADEDELVRRARANDPAAVDQLIRRYQKKVYSIAYQMSGSDPEDARDCAQEALIQVFRNLARFEGRSRFSTWLYRVVVNTCLDARRRRKRWLQMIFNRRADRQGRADADPDSTLDNLPAPENGTDPVSNVSGEELKRDVTEALSRLSEKQRMVFELKVFQEMSIPEIAAATGMAEGTVKSHLFRATQSVRGQLHRWTET
jgi:RNA polymerase sigma-70 factor (ECF subfamily)